MRAAIFRNGEIVVDRMPDPVPGPGQVLVKTLACGICGSDLHARQHAHRMVEMARKVGRKPMDLSRDSYSAMNSAARSSTTARAPRASSSPAHASARCRRC